MKGKKKNTAKALHKSGLACRKVTLSCDCPSLLSQDILPSLSEGAARRTLLLSDWKTDAASSSHGLCSSCYLIWSGWGPFEVWRQALVFPPYHFELRDNLSDARKRNDISWIRLTYLSALSIVNMGKKNMQNICGKSRHVWWPVLEM